MDWAKTESAFQNHVRDRFGGGVGQGDGNPASSELLGKFGGFSVEDNRGATSGLALHLDIAPPHTAVPAGTKRLHTRFLGGKAGGEALDAIGLGLAIANFALGKNPLQKSFTKTLNGGGHTRNFDNVDPGPYDHKKKVTQHGIPSTGVKSVTAKCSEELIAAVDQVIFDQASFGREFMRPG